MKKKILTVALACCLLFTLAACSGKPASSASTAGSAKTDASTPASQAAALERYDYSADMSGNTVDFTIAQNLKSVKCEIKSMGLELSCYCTVEDGVMTLTELVEGNEQLYSGLSAAPYTLNADGTAVPIQE